MLYGLLAYPISEVLDPMSMRNGFKHRYMVRDRFREYLQYILDLQDKALLLESTFRLSHGGIDAFVCVHSYEHNHADVKASSLLLDFGEDHVNMYFVDFDTTCRYTQTSKNKEYRQDLRKAHDVTAEFRSADARSGDMEILGYILLQCLWYRLPSKDNLKNPEYVSQRKTSPLENITLLMSKCFQHRAIPYGITVFLQHVASMKFENTRDHKRLKRVLQKSIQVSGFKPYTRLHLAPPRTPRRNSFSPKKSVLQERILAEDSVGVSVDGKVVEKPLPVKVTRGRPTTVRNNNRRTQAAT
ncbi:serine/threonine-protein kinase VRK1-like [Rhipicephalus sanguineus]|uniref:serine/threonine-protein kinase VRK1-like n=1 Tax=Rhipicephalus sanguineus TaxID=34632 RepID=UPI001894157E|nr:serine/threonine-protein kinase VRK1-like [Rhipicephalus sanguineus]